MADWRRRVGRIVTDSEGQVGGVAVTVYKAGTTTKVTLKDNKAGTEALANPFETNAQGVWDFFVDVDTLTSCDYELDIVFSKSGLDFTVMNEMYENHSMVGALVAGEVLKTDFDATTFLYATVDDTPEPKTPAEVMAILSGQATAAFDLNGQDLTNLGVIFLTEQAVAETDVADKGQIWVKAGAPNTLWFTDDAGTDVQLGLVTDGDKGDITVSASGATWTIDADVVTYDKMQDVSATDKLLGRSTAGAGTVEEITCTSAGRALLDDANATAQRSTLGLVIGTNVQAYDAELAALAGLTFADDKIIIGTGAGTVAMIDCTAFAQTILDDADAATVLATLGAAALGVNTDITGLTGLNTQNAIQISPFDVGAGQTGEIRFLELAAGGTNYVGFKAADALAGNVIWTLPIADSSGTQYLVSDGSSVLSWAAGGGGAGSDTDAIHDNVAGEIVAVTEKTTPVGNDEVLAEDSADSNNKKSVKMSNMAAATAFSSRFFGYQNAVSQYIPTNAAIMIPVQYNAEHFDGDGEFDITVTSGTADATEANKLHDADGGFTAGMVGAMVWNKTDNTYTTVSAFVDSGELTLTDDIMINGETYDIYFSRYTAAVAGYRVLVGHVIFHELADGTKGVIAIRVNGAMKALARGVIGGTATTGWSASVVVYMAANDYADLVTFHNDVAAEMLSTIAGYQGFSGHRLS